MADFANFGLTVMKSAGMEREFGEWLRVSESAQMNYASEDDPVIELVAEWFEDHGGGEVEIDTGALYSALKVLAEQKHLLLPRSASAFGKRLRELEVVLQASLSVIISKSRVGHTTRWKFTASALNQSPENDSSNSPQSTYRPPSIETNVVER
jgi:hypothetical protein